MNTHPNSETSGSATGGRHLRLVVDQETPADDDHDRPTAQHAKPAVRVPLAGSATVRALLAIGALASLLGVAVGRAEARTPLLSDPVEQADPQPDTATLKVAVEDADADTDTGSGSTSTTEHSTTRPATATAAAQWTPTVKADVRTYTPTVSPGTGRHRKPSTQQGESSTQPVGSDQHRNAQTERHESSVYGLGSGRHRKPQTGQGENTVVAMSSGRHRGTASAEVQLTPDRYVRAVAHG